TFNPGASGIGGIYDAGTGTLTLTGTAILAQYEQVLETVNYRSTAADPAVLGAPRAIRWPVTDGSAFSALQTTNVLVRPTTDLAFNTQFMEGCPAKPIADLALDILNGTFGVQSATIVLTNAKAGDILSVGSLPIGITSSVDSSVAGQITVTITGPGNAGI